MTARMAVVDARDCSETDFQKSLQEIFAPMQQHKYWLSRVGIADPCRVEGILGGVVSGCAFPSTLTAPEGLQFVSSGRDLGGERAVRFATATGLWLSIQ